MMIHLYILIRVYYNVKHYLICNNLIWLMIINLKLKKFYSVIERKTN